MNSTLEQQLRQETESLTRLSERMHNVRLEGERIEPQIAELQGQLEAEHGTAALEGREAMTEKLEKSIQKLVAARTANQTALQGIERKHREQTEKVEALQGEINSQARQRAKAHIEPKMKRVYELTTELARLSGEVFEEAARFSFQNTEYFPGARDFHEATLRLSVMASTRHLRHYLSNFTDSPFYEERGRTA